MKFWIFCVFLYPLTNISAMKDYKPNLVDKSTVLLTLEVGHTAHLKCNFFSWKPEWKMVWKMNGKVVHLKTNKRLRQQNGRSSLLRINPVVKADSGMYECIASNDYGSVSKLLNLTVVDELKPLGEHGKGPPWFTKAKKPRSVAWPASADMKLRCPADGEPPLKYQWFKDGKVLNYRPQLDPKFNSTRWYLTIRTAVPSDNGIYQCVVSNRLGRISQKINLKVIENGSVRPLLSAQFPVNKTARVGDNVTFKCIELFSPILTDYRWLHWNRLPPSYPDLGFSDDPLSFNSTYYTVINPVHYRSFPVQKAEGKYGGSVLLKSVTKEDEGMYTCVVSNYVGKGWKSAFLRVHSEDIKPYFTEKGKMKKDYLLFPAGKKLKIVCSANGRPRPSVIWYKNYKKLKNMPDGVTPLTNTNFEITFESLKPKHAGLYKCQVSNKAGVIEKIYTVKVKGKPTHNNYNIEAHGSGEAAKNSTKAIIIVVCVAFVIVVLGAIISWYCMFKRGKPKKHVECGEAYRAPPYLGKRPDPLSFTSSSISNCSTNPLLERHSIRYLKRQNSSLSHKRIDNHDWEIDRDHIRLLESIGEGAFGRVLKAKAYIPKFGSKWMTVAVKTLKDDATHAEVAVLVSELEVMKKIGRHKNIINLVGCCTQNVHFLVILEYAPGGNLRDFLRKRRHANELLSSRDLISFVYQVARGMEFLASRKCIHRDLAARNVLVGDDLVMKIADFGLAKDKTDYYRKNADGRLPLKWLALEALFDQFYTTQSDVWAFGILIWEVFTFGGTPYPSVPIENLFELLKSGYRMEKPVNCPMELYDLSMRCWSKKPEFRPSFPEIVDELNEELEILTEKHYKYIDVEAPLLSPRTPSILSIRTYSENIIVHEENVIVEKGEAKVNEKGESERIPEERSTENIIANEENIIEDEDDAQVDENGEFNKITEERSMENIIAEVNVIIESGGKACLSKDSESDEKPEERSGNRGLVKFKRNFETGDEYLVLLRNESKEIENC